LRNVPSTAFEVQPSASAGGFFHAPRGGLSLLPSASRVASYPTVIIVSYATRFSCSQLPQRSKPIPSAVQGRLPGGGAGASRRPILDRTEGRGLVKLRDRQRLASLTAGCGLLGPACWSTPAVLIPSPTPMAQPELLDDLARCLAKSQLFPLSPAETKRILAQVTPILYPKRPKGIRPREDQTSIL
jgi:hypothetical protein